MRGDAGGPKHLLVNADDLGRTEGINRGIFEAHDRGIVTSATLMVNYPSSRTAAEQLDRFPHLGIGLHVALTGSVPTLDPSRIPSLVDAQGRFPPKPEDLKAPRPEEIRAEVEAQWVRFHELTGRSPTHLDSHHHCHRLPEVCDALVAIGRREGLPVRNSSPEVGRRLHREGIPTTEFFDESFFGDATDIATLTRILLQLPSGVTELMCHPAHVDEELRSSSSYAEPREQELATLIDAGIQRLILENGIRLIHFGEL